MRYRGFEIKICPVEIFRQDKNGNSIRCDGFRVEIFRAADRVKLDEFTAAVGFELLENSLAEVEQLVMDYLGCGKGKTLP